MPKKGLTACLKPYGNNSMTDFRKQALLCIFLLAAILLLETYTNMDLRIQNMLYSAEHGWLISREAHQKLSFIFYKGIKNLVIATGVSALLVFLAGFRLPKLARFRRPALLLFLSIVLVPVIVAGSKQLTNVYCPAQLEMYGGRYPWVRVLEHYPDDFVQLKRGKCFPAGHATVGFALMMLYFCFQNRRQKIAALSAAIALGWITGIYQMLRGEHFLSHTLFTMVASWLVIIIIVQVTDRLLPANKS